MTIGQNIKYLRLERNITQEELGNILGVSNKAVSSWENDTKTPRMGIIQKMSDYFNVSKTYIIEGKEKTATPKDDGDKLLNEFTLLFENLDEDKKKLILSQMKWLLDTQE